MRYDHTSIKTAKIKNCQNTNAGKDAEKLIKWNERKWKLTSTQGYILECS